MRESKKYDFFLSQEDDVNYTVESILYFISNYNLMKRLRPPLYPNYFDIEIANGFHYASFRLSSGFVFKLQEELYFSSNHVPGGRGYIMPRALLLNTIEEGSHDFLDCKRTKGEFNPSVASGQVLMTSHKMVHPLSSWKSGGIHHMSNKYIQMELELNQTESNLASLRDSELDMAFSSCYGSKEEVNTTVTIEGSCLECLGNDEAAYMTSVVEVVAGSHVERMVKFKFVCEKYESVSFPGQAQ